jgi:chaperonin GroES
MTQTLSANSDRVIVKPVESGEERFGSIIIPDMGKERPEMGEVVSVGPGRQSEFGQFIRVEAKIGDIVLIPKSGTIKLDFDGQEYFLLPDREILATIKKVQE